MKWNSETGFIDYRVAVDQIKSKLGLPEMYHEVRRELAPYVTYIMKYLNTRLMMLGDDAELPELVQEIFDIYSEGSDLIIGLKHKDLAEKIGIEIEDWDENLEYLETYEGDRFIFSWTNILSSLTTQLRIMYASLFEDPISQGCPCPCTPGETWKDWESYSSGVYPEDEEYSSLGLGTSTSWRVTSNVPECTCKYE